LLSILIYGIVLRRRVALSLSEDAKHHRLFCWTYRLSTIVELTILGLNFAVQSRQTESCDDLHIRIALTRTVLLFCLVILSLISKPRPPPAADLKSSHPATENENGSCTYGTFDSPDCPPSASSTADGNAESPSFSQYIKVCPTTRQANVGLRETYLSYQ
jgi:hypothetical protein